MGTCRRRLSRRTRSARPHGLPPRPDRLGAGGRCTSPRAAAESAEGYDHGGAPTDAIDPLRYLGLLACAAQDLDEATKWFREAWTRRQRGSRAALAVGLLAWGPWPRREAWEPAARLFATAEALAQTEAAAFSLPARDHYERGQARAREALDAAYQASAVAGRALTLEQALAEAETGAGAGSEWECRRHARARMRAIALGARADASTQVSISGTRRATHPRP